MESNNKITKWIKDNKKKVIIAGACGIGIIICIKNKDTIVNFIESSKILTKDERENTNKKTVKICDSGLNKSENVTDMESTKEMNSTSLKGNSIVLINSVFKVN